MKSLSKEERLGVRRTVYAMWLGGLKAPAISKQTGINLSTVSRWVADFAMNHPDTPAPENPAVPRQARVRHSMRNSPARNLCPE